MAGERYDRDALAAFLDRQYRQVWAVHRETGERVFIDWGGATPEMRAYAREHLRCPVPGCDLRISARGRSKRDHFYHLGTPGHSEGEGEWHLQAKALLTAWANQQPGVTAQEEESVVIAASGALRRADVMATWSGPIRKVALEVEYKEYRPEDWAKKQADYDSADVTCTWVFGHLPRYLRQPRKPRESPQPQVWDRLKWVELTEAVARVGRPVLFINPVERAIVTVIQQQHSLEESQQDPDWWEYVDQVGTRLAHPGAWSDPILVLDPLDTCELDPERGIITPTMRRVEAERAHINELAEIAHAKAKARAAAEEERRRRFQAAAEKQRQAREDARAYAERKRAEAAQTWQRSPLRARILALHGRIPDFLDAELPYDNGIYAHPVHWHCQLFNDLVLGEPGKPMLGRSVTVEQVYRMIARAGFKMHRDPRKRATAVKDFLVHLYDQGYITFEMNTHGSIGDIEITADFANPPVTLAQPLRPVKPIAQPMPIMRTHTSNPARTAAIEDHDHPEPADEPSARWQSSSLRQAVLNEHHGQIPVYLLGDDCPHLATSINAVPAHWHAYLYMKYIHRRPTGFTFTLADAYKTLAHHGLVRGDLTTVLAALAAYLRRLSDQHQLLIAAHDSGPRSIYVIS